MSARPDSDPCVRLNGFYLIAEVFSHKIQQSRAQFDDLLLQGQVETDSTKRRAIYVEMQQIVHNDGATVLPLFLQDIFATNDKVRHPEVIGGNWELDGCKAAERWWFA